MLMSWQDPDHHVADTVGLMTGWGGTGIWNVCNTGGGGGDVTMTSIAASEFTLDGSAVVDGDVLSITQAGQNSQRGTAFAPVDATTADRININFDMYTGDGSGADGLCVNLGNNNMGGRNGEDGVAVGFALCFDEWANGDDHGVHMFQDGTIAFEDLSDCDNRAACLPVSAFEDAAWHAIMVTISPSGDAVFTLDSDVYGGAGTLADYALPDPLYIGFSGRTGGATNNHWVRNVAFGTGGDGSGGGGAPVTIASRVFNGDGDFVSCPSWGNDFADVTVESWTNFLNIGGNHPIMNDDNWSRGDIHYQIYSSAYGFDVNGNGDRTFDWQP